MKVPIVDLKNRIPQQVIDEVAEVIRSGYWVDGPQVKKLEKQFAEYCGVKYCRAVCNGTASLMALTATTGLGPGDEVIVPSFTFIATANSVLFSSARPIFADVDPKTFTVDPEDIRKKITPNTKAIMPVHLFGLCSNMKEIKEICEENELILLEDAAQAHGATIHGQKAGSFGRGAGFSLYPTKNMFAGGEGGLITTDDEELYEKICQFINHGQSKKYYHTSLGYNFRMAEINAVLARFSLHKVDEWNEKRAEHARYLNELLGDIEEIETPFVPEGYSHVYHQYTIKVKNGKRNRLIEALQRNEIGYGIHYAIPIHKQPYYQSIGYENIHLPITEKLAEEVISLPIHPELTTEQLDFISEVLHKTLKD